MTQLLVAFLAAFCQLANPSPVGTLVVVDSTSNPEFASGPSNYAHWFLAHAYPTVVALAQAGVTHAQEDGVHISFVTRESIDESHWFDGNAALSNWSNRYEELLRPWTVSFDSISMARTRAAESKSRIVPINVSVPHLSFCDGENFFSSASLMASFIRSRPQFQINTTDSDQFKPPIIFVLLRSKFESSRHYDIAGLPEACKYWSSLGRTKSWGVEVVCGEFGPEETLSESVARVLGHAAALVGAHGAGLSNMMFLPPGTAVVELDSAGHATYNRPFFQHLANAVGLRARKIFLEYPSGRERVFQQGELQHCTRWHKDGSPIDDKRPTSLASARIFPYIQKARMTTAFLGKIIARVAEEQKTKGSCLSGEELP